MITLGNILDLMDSSRESKEIVCLMNAENSVMKAPVYSPFWKPFENREVNSIEAEHSEMHIWLEQEEYE